MFKISLFRIKSTLFQFSRFIINIRQRMICYEIFVLTKIQLNCIYVEMTIPFINTFDCQQICSAIYACNDGKFIFKECVFFLQTLVA